MPASGNGTARVVADVVGTVASALCALHCLTVPIALVVGSLGPLMFVSDEVFHQVLLWLVVPTAAFAFSTGCLRHKDRGVFLLGVLGISFLFASFTVIHDVAGENGERAMTILAASLLITAHVRNFRLCRDDECEHDPA